MIHVEFGTNSKSTRVRIYINTEPPNDELEEAVASLSGYVKDAIELTNTLKLKKNTFPEIDRYSDGFKLAVEVERRPRDFKEQTLVEYKKLVKADLLDLHNIFRDLVQDCIRELKDPYPRIHFRHD